MNLLDVKREKLAKKKRFRVGRGESSGLGKTSGKGHKGQLARSGVSFLPYFEGGQMPLVRRLPKRGFSNVRFKTEFVPINLADIDKKFLEGEEVCCKTLAQKGLIDDEDCLIKILASGKLSKRVIIKAHKFSLEAIKKIKESGSSYEIINPFEKKKEFHFVKIGELERYFKEDEVVTPEALLEKKIVRSLDLPIKIVSKGILAKRLHVKAHDFSWNAMNKIRRAGGKAIVLGKKDADH